MINCPLSKSPRKFWIQEGIYPGWGWLYPGHTRSRVYGRMMYLVCLAGSGYHLPAALGARAQEQLPGALTEEYQRSGTIPNSTEKGWRPPQCWAGGKYPAHPSYCGAGIIFAWLRKWEEVRIKWQEFKWELEGCYVHLCNSYLPFYHEKITRNLAANWGCILQTLLFLTNKWLHK